MPLALRNHRDAKALLASTTQTGVGVGTGAAVALAGMPNAFAFTLDVTAAATNLNDTLNVFVQTKINGTDWIDVAHFTEVLGNGSTKRYVEKVSASPAFAGFENGDAFGDGEVRHFHGDSWRVRWAVVDPTGANAAFTFSVFSCPM